MLVIPLIYFILLLGYFYIRNGRWSIDTAATTLLVVISLCAIMIDVNDIYGDYGINEDHTTLPTIILFCVQWTIVLLPFHYIARLPIVPHKQLKKPLLYIFLTAVAISSVLMIATSMEDIIDALVMDMADVRDEHYNDLNSGAGSTKANYLMFLPQILTAAPFPTLALFFWFYLQAFTKNTRLLQGGIILASVIQAILAIIIAGRAALIYWTFDFFLIYSYFYPYLRRLTRLWINIIMGIIIAAGGSIFVAITIARFDADGRDPMESLYGYAGQHINNFCTMFTEGEDAPLQFDRIFPLMTKFTTGKSFDLKDHYSQIETHVSGLVNVFDTFGAEVYLDLGWLGYIAIMALLIALGVHIRSRWQTLEFYRIFPFVILITFFTKGIFAWPFTHHYTTFALMTMLFMTFMFRYVFVINPTSSRNDNDDIHSNSNMERHEAELDREMPQQPT